MAKIDDLHSTAAVYLRAVVEAQHKSNLIQAAAKKGPKAIAAAVDTAKKAAKRRDSWGAKLTAYGVDIAQLRKEAGVDEEKNVCPS